MNEVHLILSGPSAKGVKPLCEQVACVNGSFALIDKPPTFLCLAEKNAAKEYGDKAREFAAQGTRILGRYWNRPALPMLEPISHTMGPGVLRLIHDDCMGPMPHGAHGLPGNSRPWCTAGVLMLWWLMESHGAKRVFVSGLDGYGAGPLEYADGVQAARLRPQRTPEWCDMQNQKIEQSMLLLTHWYADVSVVLVNHPPRPVISPQRWLVTKMQVPCI